MKKIIIAAAVATFALSSGTAFAAGDTASATGVAEAVVVGPLQLYHVTNAALNFGAFAAGTAGTVTIDAITGAGVSTGPVYVTGSTTSADGFTVAGDPNRGYAITTTGGTITAAGGLSMPFTTSASASNASLSAVGTGSFTVGGVLTVSATQGAGSYLGSYNATVTYN